MALTKVKLGELIELSENKTIDPNIEYSVVGLSTQKEIIKTKADLTDVDLSSYKLMQPKVFAYVADTSRRGDKISLVYNKTQETYLLSPISIIFYVKDEESLLSDYLFMYFNRPEFDRYTRFNSWGSARETFTWEDMCDITLSLPPLSVQRKYVNIYQAMLKNQKCYEQGLDDLKLVCDGYIENLRRNMKCEEIGKYIELSIDRNKDYEITTNKAVSIEKIFVNTHADLTGVDTSNYFVVKKNMFAYNTVTTRNGEKISIALNDGEDCLVSPIYTVFGICKEGLIPEYLILWFKRTEFDRYARFNSWGSAREMFSFEDMQEVKIPIPSIDIQQSIANIYKVYTRRKQINEQLKKKLKEICPVLIKGSIEEG